MRKCPGSVCLEADFKASGQVFGWNDSGSWMQYHLPLGPAAFVKYETGEVYFVHHNALGSSTMATDHAGTVMQEELPYPWGQFWRPSGIQYSDQRAASLWVRDPLSTAVVEGKLDTTLSCVYESRLARWLRPDPLDAGLRLYVTP